MYSSYTLPPGYPPLTAHLERTVFPLMTNNFHALYKNRRFITAFKTASSGPYLPSFNPKSKPHSLAVWALDRGKLTSDPGRFRPKKAPWNHPTTRLGESQSRFEHFKGKKKIALTGTRTPDSRNRSTLI